MSEGEREIDLGGARAVPLDLQSIDLGVFFNEILGDVSGFRSIKLEDILKDKLVRVKEKKAN